MIASGPGRPIRPWLITGYRGGEQWMRFGACRTSPSDGPDWFAEPGTPAAVLAASICIDCPVRTTCLSHALTAGERSGVWGGLNEAKRARLHRLVDRGTDPSDIAAVIVGDGDVVAAWLSREWKESA